MRRTYPVVDVDAVRQHRSTLVLPLQNHSTPHQIADLRPKHCTASYLGWVADRSLALERCLLV